MRNAPDFSEIPPVARSFILLCVALAYAAWDRAREARDEGGRGHHQHQSAQEQQIRHRSPPRIMV